MKKMFFNKNSAFYKSVKHLPIAEIPFAEWSLFIKNGFKEKGIDINYEAIEKILTISNGFPYYTQQIAYELFNVCDSGVDDINIKDTVRSILDREEDLFLQEWENLSLNQKKALKLIIVVKGDNLYGSNTMNMFGLNGSSLKKAVEGLINKDVIDKSANRYYLQDPMFEYYVRARLIGHLWK